MERVRPRTPGLLTQVKIRETFFCFFGFDHFWGT